MDAPHPAPSPASTTEAMPGWSAGEGATVAEPIDGSTGASTGALIGALIGSVAAGAALATGELVSGLAGRDASLLTAVGNTFVDRFAARLKDVAVRLFGTNDKASLVVGIVVVSLGLGALLGVTARRRHLVAPLAFGAFASLGAVALAAEPQIGLAEAVLDAVLAATVGTATLLGLLVAARRQAPALLPDATIAPDAAITPGAAVVPGDPHDRGRVQPIVRPDRPTRRALLATGAVGAVAVGAAAAGHRARGTEATAARPVVRLPLPTTPTITLPASFDVPGLSPFLTPTADFYRIDTALLVPRVDVSTWRLQIDGLVDGPLSLSYADLVALADTEEVVTLRCVSDEVGGDLLGTARWQGVPLASLLERVGVHAGADQLVGHAVDGWTAGFPTSVALDGRPALVAVAMNGEPLPAAHGFPARLVVAGLYGYVSATKWLRRIELTTWDAFDGYWVPRGWSKTGPMKLAARIDVPGAQVRAGRVAIAGVAWAPVRGIAAVEVRVDDGDWQPCELGETTSGAAWVQWRHDWDAAPGDHRLSVRATAADGEVQTEEVRPPEPDGATGLHTRRVRVSP